MIAKTVTAVLREFQIANKVINFVTDNAPNMVKAFRLVPDMCQDRAESQNCDEQSTVELVSVSDLVNDILMMTMRILSQMIILLWISSCSISAVLTTP